MNRTDALVGGLLSAGLMAALLPFARLGMDMHHDGIMLKPALDVLSGQTLFRDTFMQYGALTCYLQVLALWIHPTLLTLKFQAVAAYGLSLFFLYAAWREILPRSLAILSCGLFLLFFPCYEKVWDINYWVLIPWSSVFALLFQSIGLYALFQVIRGGHPRRWGVVLGVATACVCWCRQPVGAMMTVCLIAIWLALLRTGWQPARDSRRSVLTGILAGFAAVNALLLGVILCSGARAAWWYQNVVWPSKWVAGEVDENIRYFLSHFIHPAAGAWLLGLALAAGLPAFLKRIQVPCPAHWLRLFYLGLGLGLAWQHERVLHALALRDGGWTALLPCVVLLQAGGCLLPVIAGRNTPRSTEYYLVAALAALSVGSLFQFYPVPDTLHIVWSLAPAFGLLVHAFWRWVDWPARVVAAVLSLAFVPSIILKGQAFADAMRRPLVMLSAPSVLQGMKVEPEMARHLGQIGETVQEVLRHRPDIPGALIGNNAMVLCFTNNHANPSPYFVTWRGLVDKRETERRWDNIRRTRPMMFLQKADWAEIDDFYQRARYVPLRYIPGEDLEIAVPQELAVVLGRTAYGPTTRTGGTGRTP